MWLAQFMAADHAMALAGRFAPNRQRKRIAPLVESPLSTRMPGTRFVSEIPDPAYN